MATGGVLFDIDGVLVTSWQPIPGARETLQALAAKQAELDAAGAVTQALGKAIALLHAGTESADSTTGH